ncbi:1-acyl-sn-glycerol-3-phosphate acyltransferase [Billgrantia tianxiuensis]|jgi:1-acyl-sn-glycerol-3-phosphate acyltransferase|uniref:1-acyl-sn-glycerol-3-phosphate acyltransferase n=1 Tax=Billgrantia tianxiuensis TaxID=2497861 RepID=A0A6I6SQV4_9GAMM|nr:MULTISPECIES: lysophospholipid acyltransferase family protein [Halomonas]MCE8034140.1 1-acyl-sn-glycerol-3-phosphate acyltransferase [Halomonas sp. MCCC 1A11057]QHC51026.1 1-acyl-sn-glycerol-3-phosphate acyltransferase [Halomonas tianxiuensis]
MKLDRWWRGLGTALSFIAFGLGGVFIGLAVAPLLSLCVHDTERRQRMARHLIQRCFRGFIGLMRCLGVLDYHFSHQERLQRPGLLVLANHPSLIDVIFLLAHMPHANCIVKGRLASNPFTRGPIRAAGYITNNEPEAVLEAAGESLRRGDSLVLFPEGTRTKPQRPIKFRRGGANIALRTKTAITPVLIRCTPTTLTKGEPWYHIPASKVRMELHVLEDLPINDDNQQPTGQLARILTHRLNNHFNRELGRLHHERDMRPNA